MASSRNFTRTGVKSTSRSVSTCEGFKILPSNNVLMESSENQVERRLTILENLLRDHLNEENAQVKQLIDRILELDEQLEKQIIRIKLLENQAMPLQSPDSKRIEVGSLIQAVVKENIEKQMEIPSAIRFEDGIARKTGIDLNKNGSNQILESGTRTVKQQLEDSNSKNNLNKTQLSNKLIDKRVLENNSKSETNVGKNKSTPSSIMTSRSSEPNSLCSDCHPTISAKEPLRRWQLQSQPGRRLVEIKAMFEYKQADPSSLEGSKISSPSNIKEIINRASIKTYFDMICRDGSITAGIGEYLHLSKENIFGGIDCESQYDRVTFVNVDLCQSIINLADDRIDLITCFIALHHILEFELTLSEFVRIIRPNGYLIIREHDCKKERTLQAKYLNFVHAFMMIARVAEFDSIQNNHSEHNQVKSEDDLLTHTIDSKQATLDYDQNPSTNPQTLYYAVFKHKYQVILFYWIMNNRFELGY
ncbi:unnamed protein product [Rotaria magnacalcarata]|uniref:Methyltransferase type 11 domain-containing protein n=1 Tax=Rotaria magnacalcarata TaxID=392030 RepID=A0A816RDV4_9BILA|nr:unnamed protein product [Rotaria magnacalcarata]